MTLTTISRKPCSNHRSAARTALATASLLPGLLIGGAAQYSGDANGIGGGDSARTPMDETCPLSIGARDLWPATIPGS